MDFKRAALLYGAAGAATLAWSYIRAARGVEGKPGATYVWPGLGKTPPGAVVGAVETVVFWPIAAAHMLSPPARADSSQGA